MLLAGDRRMDEMQIAFGVPLGGSREDAVVADVVIDGRRVEDGSVERVAPLLRLAVTEHGPTPLCAAR